MIFLLYLRINASAIRLSFDHDEFKDTLLLTMLYMHMNRLMLIGIEVEYKSEIFEYFRHNIYIISRCKDTHNSSFCKKNFADKCNLRRKSCLFAA